MIDHPPTGFTPAETSYMAEALQLAELPVSVSRVHELPSLQEVGQLPGGSQVSPGSRTEFPQLAEQSLSVVASHPLGQLQSPLWRLSRYQL